MNKNGVRDAVGIMARFPVAGQTKTRLAADVGPVLATAIYSQCARLVFREIRCLPDIITKYVFIIGCSNAGEVLTWTGPGFNLRRQAGADLGKRLRRAFDELFSAGSGRAIIMASDVPDISANMVTEALAALGSHDVVLGPSQDGGYYLIGTCAPHHELFRDIAWGTEEVLAQTVARTKMAGLTVQLLRELVDIDNIHDYEQWLSSHNDRVETGVGLSTNITKTPNNTEGVSDELL